MNDSDHMAQVSQSLEQLSRSVAELTSTLKQSTSAKEGIPESNAISKAKRYLAARRRREQLFGRSDLFADPVWDMLIDLYIAQAEGRKVAVSDLCIASNVPASTALRWIRHMSDHELVARVASPSDRRRIYVHLTAETAKMLEQFFEHDFV